MPLNLTGDDKCMDCDFILSCRNTSGVLYIAYADFFFFRLVKLSLKVLLLAVFH